MSIIISADDMFKKLGYTKLEEVIGEDKRFAYKSKKGMSILFGLNKKLMIENPIRIYSSNYMIFSIEELQAINEKCKELGWLE